MTLRVWHAIVIPTLVLAVGVIIGLGVTYPRPAPEPRYRPLTDAELIVEAKRIIANAQFPDIGRLDKRSFRVNLIEHLDDRRVRVQVSWQMRKGQPFRLWKIEMLRTDWVVTAITPYEQAHYGP